MSEDLSLITEEARALIGVEVERSQGRVVKREFQLWAAAVKDRNPLYFDAAFARAHGYRDVVMPPLFLSQVTRGVPDLNTLGPDGIAGGAGSGDVPLPRCPRRAAGGQKLRLYEPIYDGDDLTATRVIENIEEKRGRSDPFVLVTSHTTYVRADGITVAEAVFTLIALP
jgi:hydroxyacyl-ACP dehydratase HTD2-like protein with hotdog domain